MYRAILSRWPRYKLEDLPKLTPAQHLWLLENDPFGGRNGKTLTFDSEEDLDRWLTNLM